MDYMVIFTTPRRRVTGPLQCLTLPLLDGQMVRFLPWTLLYKLFLMFSVFVMNVVIFLDCPISLPSNVPVIRGDITCNLGTTCSDVVCCLYAKPLLRHVTIYLKMEFCRDRIILGIDRYTREIQPSTYKNWGKVLQYKLYMLCLINIIK